MLASVSLDSAFGVAGQIETAFPDGGIAVAELMDRKVVIVGSTSASSPNLSIARFNVDGSLDVGFGSSGRVTVFPCNSLADAVIQTNGMVTVTGRNSGGLFIARVKPDGQLDPSFSNDGIAPLDDKIPGDATPSDLDLNDNGQIVVVGSTTGGGSFVVRMKPDGSVDKSFSGDGVLFMSSGGIGAGELTPDGKVLAGDGMHQLTRYTATGVVDTAFAENGSLNIDNPRALEVQSDGRFVLVTAASTGSFQTMDVARYTADGKTPEWLDSWSYRRSSAAIAVDPGSGVVSIVLDEAYGYASEIIRYGGTPDRESIPFSSPLRGTGLATTGTGGLIVIGVNGKKGFAQRLSPPQSPIYLLNGILSIRGEATSDTIGLTVKDQSLRIRRNGVLQTFELSRISRVEISASGGNDIIDFSGIAIPTYVDAGTGNDMVTAGSGADSLTGGAGKDTLSGGEGDDRINGNGTNDRLFGEGGNDRIYGGAHNDFIDGGGGVDRVWGETGNDTISGGSSNDKLDGGPGDDSILGGKGNDLLVCGGGVDALFGNDGDDDLRAADGVIDLLDGGVGADKSQGDKNDTLLHIETVS